MFARQCFDHSANTWTLSWVKNLEMLSIKLPCPKEMELKVVEKPRVGILSVEKKGCTQKFTLRDILEKKGWKKFNMKFEFFWIVSKCLEKIRGRIYYI